MLLVKTNVQASPIHGKGVFAAEDMMAGRVVWRFDPKKDKRIELEAVKSNEHLMAKCYVNPQNPGIAVFCGDDAQFLNFNDKPNLACGLPWKGEFDLVAIKLINKGEELTVHPLTDADSNRKLGRKP